MPCAHLYSRVIWELLFQEMRRKYFVADMEAPCVYIPETVEAILSSDGIHAETSCHSHHRQMREHAVQIHKEGK